MKNTKLNIQDPKTMLARARGNDSPVFEIPPNSSILIKTKDEYNAFILEWKKIVSEDRKNSNSLFAPLMVYRNIVLQDDIFKGFTPSHKMNSLINGYGFMTGWTNAYQKLIMTMHAMNKGQFNLLSSYIVRLAMTKCSRYGRMSFPVDKMTTPSQYYYIVGSKTFMGNIQLNLIENLSKDKNMPKTSIGEMLELEKNKAVFNIIKEEDYINFKSSNRFNEVLNLFAEKYLQLIGLQFSQNLVDCRILDLSDGTEEIFITTTVGKSIEQKMHTLPISHLWKTEWILQYSK